MNFRSAAFFLCYPMVPWYSRYSISHSFQIYIFIRKCMQVVAELFFTSILTFLFLPLVVFAKAMSSFKGRGAFILFEGMDRCGKSTQVQLLSQYLQRSSPVASVEDIRFPNRDSHIGQLINSYLSSASNLSDQTIHLLFSANRWEQAADIREKLSAGTTLVGGDIAFARQSLQHNRCDVCACWMYVYAGWSTQVCDRYAYSGVAYSSAKGLDTEWCKSGDVGLPRPDCVIFMNMPVELAARRGQYGEERYEKLDFQRLIQQRFLALQAEDRTSGEGDWLVVDATQRLAFSLLYTCLLSLDRADVVFSCCLCWCGVICCAASRTYMNRFGRE